MSIHTHILDKPNKKLKSIIEGMDTDKAMIKAYFKKHKTFKGLEKATGIKLVD